MRGTSFQLAADNFRFQLATVLGLSRPLIHPIAAVSSVQLFKFLPGVSFFSIFNVKKRLTLKDVHSNANSTQAFFNFWEIARLATETITA